MSQSSPFKRTPTPACPRHLGEPKEQKSIPNPVNLQIYELCKHFFLMPLGFGKDCYPIFMVTNSHQNQSL